MTQRYQGIIAPDKGSIKRATDVARACHIPVYLAEKHRDPDTGRLSEFTCEPLPDEGKFLVVDDICDGGGTFMGLANATGLPMERLGLYVSHGVFSGQAENLFAYFDEIWTTDSLQSASKFIAGAKERLIDPSRANLIRLDQTLNGYHA
jgi:ribose-phosphate pyrophosphokinase